MQNDTWWRRAEVYKPLIDTNRTAIPLMKHPQDLDFSKTVGYTTYVVKSHFNPQGNESLLIKVSRLMGNRKDSDE